MGEWCDTWLDGYRGNRDSTVSTICAYLASMLIASGGDVKVVQARLRHASAKTTLDTYAHLWPDSDETTRAAIDVMMAARADYLRTRDADER